MKEPVICFRIDTKAKLLITTFITFLGTVNILTEQIAQDFFVESAGRDESAGLPFRV